MDYKYIEQLLERYWACETSLQEEQILHSFFAQDDMPEHLSAYKAIFMAQQPQEDARLSKDFDSRILSLIDEEETAENNVVTAHRIRFSRRIRPFYQAAGLLAMLLVIGLAAQHSFNDEEEQTTQFAEQQEMTLPENEFTPIPNQQSAAIPEVVIDSMNYTR